MLHVILSIKFLFIFSDLPQDPNVDPFNYESMKAAFLERLDLFHAAPFTVQRICELLTDPRKQYSRIDKFMRAIEKNLLVVSTIEPGRETQSDSNSSADAVESALNGDLSTDVNEENEEMKIDDEDECEKSLEKIAKDIDDDFAADDQSKEKSNITADDKNKTENVSEEKNADEKMDDDDVCKKTDDKDVAENTVKEKTNEEQKESESKLEQQQPDEKSISEQKDEAVPSTSEIKSSISSTSSNCTVTTPVASGSKSTESEMSEADSDFLEKIKVVEEKLTSYLDSTNKSAPGKMLTDLLENCLVEFEKAQKIDQRIIPILTKIAQHASIANQTRTLLSAISLVSHPALAPILKSLNDERLNDERLNENLKLLIKSDVKDNELSPEEPSPSSSTKSDTLDENIEDKSVTQSIEISSEIITPVISNEDDKKIDDQDISSDSSSDALITPPNETISQIITNESGTDKNIELEENTSSSTSSSSSSSSSQDTPPEPTTLPKVEEIKLPSIDTIVTDEIQIPTAIENAIPPLEPLDDIPVLDALASEEPFTPSTAPIVFTSTIEPIISEPLPPVATITEQQPQEKIPDEIPPIEEIPQTIPEPITTILNEESSDAVLLPEIDTPLLNPSSSSMLSPMQETSESSNDTMDTTVNSNEVKMDDDDETISSPTLTSTVSATSTTDSVLGSSLSELIAKEDIAMDIDESVEPMDQ